MLLHRSGSYPDIALISPGNMGHNLLCLPRTHPTTFMAPVRVDAVAMVFVIPTFLRYIHHNCSESYISHKIQFLEFPLPLLRVLLHCCRSG